MEAGKKGDKAGHDKARGEYVAIIDQISAKEIENSLREYFSGMDIEFDIAITALRIRPEWNAKQILCRDRRLHPVEMMREHVVSLGALYPAGPIDFGVQEGEYLVFLAMHSPEDKHERHWPPERFRKVNEWAKSRDLPAKLIAGIRKGEEHGGILARKTGMQPEQYDIKGLINVFRKARCVIGPDCGPLHLADFVMASDPDGVLGLYGGTNPQTVGPYHHRRNILSRYQAEKDLPGEIKEISSGDVIAWLEKHIK